MPKCHLYFPENDLALAANLDNYTPPRQAQVMHRDGATLPLWYGHPGDVFIATGINGQWYETMAKAFNLQVDLYSGDASAYIPAPWGWSRAARRALEHAGFNSRQLPDDAAIEHIRDLSHRRVARDIALALTHNLDFPITIPAIEVHTTDEAIAAIRSLGQVIIKTPWSNAGRGIIPADSSSSDTLTQRLTPIISRYGSVMVEKRHQRIMDFAMLFNSTSDGVKHVGLSVFDTDDNGAYTGNIVANDEILKSFITRYIPSEHLDQISCLLTNILSSRLTGQYEGPLGVDMLVARHGDTFILDPAVELNLRMTMGHVAHRLAIDTLAHGHTARFSITPNTKPHCDFNNPTTGISITNHMLTSGSLRLNPPSCPTSITLTTL